MFYSERELLGAIVVDSEGYVAGIVERLTPQEEGLQIVVRRKRGGKRLSHGMMLGAHTSQSSGSA